MLFRPMTFQEASLILSIFREQITTIEAMAVQGHAIHDHFLKNSFSQADVSGGVQSNLDQNEIEMCREQLKECEKEIRLGILELQQYGIIVRSVFPTRIDFRSERHKQPVYLCCKNHHEEISCWHPIEEPCSDRYLIQNQDEFGSATIH